MRVALISQAPPAVQGFTAICRELGHEVVGLLCRPGREIGVENLVAAAPEGLDVLVPSGRGRVAPLLRALEPDVALCAGFPWKLSPEALAVPPLGIVNSHPSALPRYRGPIPISWAIRNGDHEIAVTFHRMDAELDTGAILAQKAIPLGDEHSWAELGPNLTAVSGELLPLVLERVERGEPGEPQDESQATYSGFFESEYAWIDRRSSRREVARQVQAWRFAGAAPGGERGALAELDGETVRVLRVSLEPAGGREIVCSDGPVWIVESEPA